MAEQLKNIYTKDFLLEVSEKVQSVYHDFQAVNFITSVMNETWDRLALKVRTRQISENLEAFLPSRYDNTPPLSGRPSNCAFSKWAGSCSYSDKASTIAK